MKVKSEFNLPKKIISTTGVRPDIFNDDLYFRFNANDVHTTNPKELDAMFAELDVHVAKYKAKMNDAVCNRDAPKHKRKIVFEMHPVFLTSARRPKKP